MKKLLAMMGLFAILAIPSTLSANAACCCSDSNSISLGNSCPGCQMQCVNIPKKHFWNLKRTGFYVLCPCEAGGAAPVCPTAIGECISPCTPSRLVIIPKRHFWEKDKSQRMPIANVMPSCGCQK